MEGRTAWRAVRRLMHGDGMVYAGHLAFLSLLALLPVLSVLFWLSQQSGIIKAADAGFREFLFTNLFPDTAKQIVAVVDKLRANARNLGVVSGLLIVVDLILKALALSAAVDRIWGRVRRDALGFVRAVIVVLLLVPTGVAATYWGLRFLERFLMALFPKVSHAVDIAFDPLTVGMPLIMGLTIIYKWVPARITAWRSPFVSAVVVTVLIELARFVITQYFAKLQQLKSLYGAFIALPVLMVTLFVMWLLVLFGMALVAEGFGRNFRWMWWRKRSSK